MDRADSATGSTADLPLPPGDFGVVLAALRAHRGWSVRETARRVHVSEGQICNLESGSRNPTPAVATACDAAFGAGGELVERARARGRDIRADEVVDAAPLVDGYEQILRELKDVGRSGGPRFVIASMKSITRTLTEAGPHAVGERSADIWLLASRFAEYTGWMAQESGNPAEALNWTARAVRWGARGGDETVAAYALVRKACIAQHRGDAAAAVSFAAQAAGHPAATPEIRAHADRRAAQAYAHLGDAAACREALERFRDHAAEAAGERAPHWGPRLENANPLLIEASCMLSLRRFGPAADLFAAERRPDAPADSNSQARFAVRRATALAGAGRIDEACLIAEAALPVIRRIDSATVRGDLGRFVAQVRTGRPGPGRHALIAASAALATG
ncbi:helix-turn-helix domain-containing protein [Streptomyces sp. NBC_01463]